METLKIIHLCPVTGNLLTLVKRCEWRGIRVEVSDEMAAGNLYLIGGGCELHKDFLIEQRDKGAVFLGVGEGYELLGSLGLLDIRTVEGEKRFVGNVTATADFLKPKTIVGFENHSGRTYLQGETKPLAIVSTGCGNNGEDKTEGARYKNVFGTYLNGPVLPKNPHFADYLLELALGHELTPLDDEIELKTHQSLVGKAY